MGMWRNLVRGQRGRRELGKVGSNCGIPEELLRLEVSGSDLWPPLEWD